MSGVSERLQISLSAESHEYLERLAKKGTHGTKKTDVARTLIEAGIRDAIEKRYINMRPSED